MAPRADKPGLHPRNRHLRGYDFPRLIVASPELESFVHRVQHGGPSIDFADPAAVRALNRALLAEAYGISDWDIPPGYLCPPIPGRADYVHHVADLLGQGNGGAIPRGASVRVLDVGVGASAIYPLIGRRDYGWSFVGSDIDPIALASALRIVAANPDIRDGIELRQQADRRAAFAGVVKTGELFDLTVCNPPFHASLHEAREAASRKWRKLGRGGVDNARNFGGQDAELWSDGGEVGFIQRMIQQSASLGAQVRWFTTLASVATSLPALERALRGAGASDRRTVAMAQGQKRSRFVAWTFFNAAQCVEWRERWRAS